MARKAVTAKARIRYRYQYAAKFLCTANIPGTSQTTSSLLPGVYVTVVNIHNSASRTARIRKKLAITTPPEISKFITDQLASDEAVKVDCEQVTHDYGIVFIHGVEGFLVIESTESLDVIAVYTAGHRGGEVESLAVERVHERILR
jgi:hypothetical protein